MVVFDRVFYPVLETPFAKNVSHTRYNLIILNDLSQSGTWLISVVIALMDNCFRHEHCLVELYQHGCYLTVQSCGMFRDGPNCMWA